MDTINKPHHKHMGWIIGLVVLAAILILVSMIVPKTAARPDQQVPAQNLNTSDDAQAINSDINGSLNTDFNTDGLGY